jgi:P4 family phage/plasmid primase-like protien
MQNEIKEYAKEKLVIFSIDVKQKKHKNGTYKKEISFPPKWTDFTLDKTYVNEKYNGVSILTGKINNLIIIDIDNVEHWNKLLEENCEKEPDTVKVISGSGGIHYYFHYDKDLEEVKSKDHCFGKDYDIDIKTNGGCVIAPPTKYYNENLKKEVEYKWEKSIFEHKPSKMPKWIKKLLLEKKTENQKVKKELIKENNNECIQTLINQSVSFSNETSPLVTHFTSEVFDDSELNFTISELKLILDMLNEERNNSYNDWINIGMCLYNINTQYLLLWMEWSQKSDKYEDGACEEKWNSFKKEKNGLKIGSLLLWAKKDNPLKYDDFMKKKKMNKMILSKYPNEKIILGETQKISDRNSYTHLKNKECFIKGCEHTDMPNSMYIDILDKFMTIKCRHPECFGKIYPCQHMMMTKNEMNVTLHGDVNITINNNSSDEEFVDFQQIDIYDDPKLNELVYNSLNGKSLPLADIIYYYYENEYMYSEDENWYVYKNHKWKNLGKKNNDLRFCIQPKLKSLYKDLYTYYKENEYDKQKIKSLKNTISMFDDVNLKNNIMTELIDIYTVKKNPNRDFIQKLDSNNNLIGFNNGVFDLTTFEFREGKQEDYISLSIGYDYSDKHTEKYNDLLKFLEDIQPNKEEREYMLTYLSIGLIGNQLELFTILTGCGRNGKSKLVELLKDTLGDYFGSVQSQLFTRPRPDANSPDPGLLSLMNKRIVIASEPEKNSRLNSGFIKFITGRDSTTLRNCHSNDMINFTAKFITLLICNDIPDCDDIDNAFSKRLRCINFPTEFVNEPKLHNQKQLDVNINKNFNYWKYDFMLLLIEYYKKYTKTHNLNVTENILKWTNQYKKDTDMYLQFLNEYVEETNDDKDRIHCVSIYSQFKEWFKFNNPNSKIPSDREFVKNLRKYKKVEEDVRIGDKVRRGIKNNKFINQNNE